MKNYTINKNKEHTYIHIEITNKKTQKLKQNTHTKHTKIKNSEKRNKQQKNQQNNKNKQTKHIIKSGGGNKKNNKYTKQTDG